MCGVETPYDEQTNINLRFNYVEGCGQLCNDCYTGKNTISIPKSVVRDTPNDQELGSFVRHVYNQPSNNGSYEDLLTYRRGKCKH